jgi:hypothetical protein
MSNRWEGSRRLLIGTTVVVAAALAVELVVAGGRRRAAAEIENGKVEDGKVVEKGNRQLADEIEKLTSSSQAVSKALAQLEAERKGLSTVMEGLRGVLLDIPANSRYRVPPARRNDALFYFQEQRDALRKERTEGRGYPAEAPLGFTADLQAREKDQPELLLERLAAVDRLTAAVQRAGVVKVNTIRHGAVRVHSAKGVKDLHVACLPMQLIAVADERALVALLTEVSRERSFLALDGLSLEVTNPKARTFVMRADVSALIERKSPGPKGPAAGGPGRPPPVGRY